MLGPNGAGKTTVINILSGLLLKDSGTITILGRDPEKEREYVKNRMNVASAYFGLTDIITVEQNLKVYAKLYKVKNSAQKITQLLEQFNILELRKKPIMELSSGQRTRVSLCKGFINDPEVVLLDECTIGLDPDIASVTRKVLKQYQQENGTTILFTSHYMQEVEQLCDRVALLHKGKILQINTAKKLMELIKHQTAELTFLNSSPKISGILAKYNIKILRVQAGAYLLEVSATEHILYKAINKLFQAGFRLKDLSIHKPTLEDLFIRVARGEKL